MNFLKTGLFITTLSSLMFFSGCSDLFQKNVKDKKLESSKFKANCELNVDDFALILEEPITETIDCLGKNLNLFMDVAESKKANHLSRVGLENYLKNYRKEIKPEVLRALRSIFEINYLVYGGDPDFISRGNVKALIDFAKVFNITASKNFKPIFMDEDEIEYENYRLLRDQRIKEAATVISNTLRKLYKPHQKNNLERSLDLNQLLDSFTTENNTVSIQNVKKLLFLKKVVLGGNKNTITHIELGHLIDNFSSYVVLALDGIRYKNIRMNQENIIHFLNSDVELLNRILYSFPASREKEVFFTLEQALDAVDIFLGDDSDTDLWAYYDLLKEAKVMVMDGSPETVTGGDMKRLIDHALTVLKTGDMFHKFWYSERFLLETRPGRPLDAYLFEDLYKTFKNDKKLVDDFVRILKKYRFQRGENLAAYYTDDYYRNADAVYEVALWEYALTLVMKRFGCPNNTLNGKVVCDPNLKTLNNVHMVKDQVINLVQKFKKVLIDNDLILPGREVKTAETITLLGSLFQYQSDENKVFDVNEATEFAISLFTAIDISEDVNDHFLKLNRKGQCAMDQYKRISPSCFDEHFFQAVCFNYPDQFPKLYKSLGATVYEDDPVRRTKKLVCKIPSDAANLAYLDRSVVAARTCNKYPDTGEFIYYSKGDIMSVFLAMMHIETTIIRWDVREKNNIMDPAEVMDAYNIYSPALDGFLEKMPSLVKRLKKQIYQYLVKYEKVPSEKEFSSILKFVKFLMSFNKDAPANRKTVASILVTISEQGAPSTFDCNCLHDPDRDDVQRCQEESERRNGGNPPPVENLYTPASLTRDDMRLYREVESENDNFIKRFLTNNWPEVFSF